MDRVEEVRRLISSAFPAQRFYGPITSGCECDECTSLAESLRYRTWDTVDNDTIGVHFGSLPLLTTEAFRAFAPAWLIRSLDALEAKEHQVREWTLYSLALYHDDVSDDADALADKGARLRRLYNQLTRDQSTAIMKFLLLIRDHSRVSEWDKASIERTLPLLQPDSP